MPGGGKGGGKGTIGANVGVDAHLNAVVDANTNATVNSSANLTSDNKIDTNATALLQLVGLDNIRLTADATTDNKAAIEMDVKPLQVDLCMKVGLERLPSTRIFRPSTRHLGITLFGVEIFGVDYVTEKKTVIEDLGNRPFVVQGPVVGTDGRGEECCDGVRMSVED